jgi:uncharacterized membrane protein
MKNMKILFVLLLVLGFAFSALSVSSYSTSASSFKPGSRGIISVVISNPTSSSALVSGIEVDTTNPPEITTGNSQFIGDLEVGGSSTVSIPFTVTPNARSGIYTVQLDISGISDRPGSISGGFEAFSRKVSIPITIVNAPIFTISTDNPTISDIETLNLSIVNNGGLATNVRISTPYSDSPVLSVVDQVYVQSISSSSSVPITLDSRSINDGPTNVKFYIEYNDELGISHADNYSIRLAVKKQKLDVLFTQTSSILTRKESLLSLGIRNVGSVPLKDVRLVFTNSSIRLKDSNELKFGDVAPLSTAGVSNVALVDLPPGLNHVSATLSWVEKDVQKETTIDVPLTITSDADVGVYLEAKPSPLVAGSEHTVSVLVSNIGSYPIDNVEVSFASDSLTPFDISPNQYIGYLNADDFSTVQFKIRVKPLSEGQYPVNIKISYRDRSGEWKVKEISRDVFVTAPKQSGNPVVEVILLLVVIAAGVWYFKFRKKPERA